MANDTVDVRLLGPVEVLVSERRTHLSPLESRLLTTLALAEGRAVSVERIVDMLWGESPPGSARNRVQALVSGVRRALGAAHHRLTTTAAGYRLDAEVDAVGFERDVERARELAAQGALAAAADAFHDALGRWRGEPLRDVPGLAATAARLDELRMAAFAERIDVELALGRHAELTGELTSMVAEYPLRERFAGQLMLALYRAGRQAEALEAYQSLRSRLDEELGLEPGAELARLHEQILRRDAALDRTLVPASTARPAQLPRDMPDFTGRAEELMQLMQNLDPSRTVVISALDGMGGIGKTTLAVYAGHRLAKRFPDGQLFVDLRAHTAGAEPMESTTALDFLLRSIGVEAERIPTTLEERAALWRSELAGRRMLVVLDNAAGAEQVGPLLPGTAGCLVLITSRSRLCDLDGAQLMSLDVLPIDDAIALLVAIAGPRAVIEADAATEVVELCGRLPLAIRIAGSRLRDRPQWSMAFLAERLRDRRRRLTELSVGDRAVSAAFELSYRQLDPDQRRFFRLLGLHPGGDFDSYAAAALAAVPLGAAEALLESLLDVHLVEHYAQDRYRFHDLMREHARNCADAQDSPADRLAAVHRLLDYYLCTARLAGDVFHPGREPIEPLLVHPPDDVPRLDDVAAAANWFDTERGNLVQVVRLADGAGLDRHAWLLPREMCGYLLANELFADCIAVNEIALAAARRSADRQGEQLSLLNLTIAVWRIGRVARALDLARSALDAAVGLGDRRIEAFCHGQIAVICGRTGDLEPALKHFDAALAFVDESGPRGLAGYYRSGRAFSLIAAGRHREALADATEAIAINRECGNQSNEAEAQIHAAMALGRLGRHPQAFEHIELGLSLARDTGRPALQSDALRERAQLQRQLGRYEDAFASAQLARDVIRAFTGLEPECEIQLLLGQLHGDIGNHQVSLEHHREALELARRIGYRIEEAGALDGIARALAASGDLEGAREHRRRALSLHTEMGTYRPA